MSNHTIKVTDQSFEKDVLRSIEPVLVDFWAPWCGPCLAIAPILDEVAQEMAGKIKIAKVNVDENQGIAAKYGIRSIPTLMLFKSGQLAGSKVGSTSKSALIDWIRTSA